MLTVRVGKTIMQRKNTRCILQISAVLVLVVVVYMLILEEYNSPFINEWSRYVNAEFDVGRSSQTSETLPKDTDGGCFMNTDCPDDHFSFFMKSGAANVVAPKICIQNKVVLGTMLNNAGSGLNIVVMNGKTGEVTKTNYFNMYGGEVEPLIEFLKSIEQGTVVLIASWDDPSTKLNDDAKKLMAELGSSVVHSLGFRDNWLFVGGKGATVKSNFEKHLKNVHELNKYENWPELLELKGCIPKYMN
ncbi:protein FAM3C [Pagrus major]|uniref:protein FAM3C n=1 Tax=Pagrus major TaxID=143350 RepID=UPI003CC853B6